MTMEDEIAETCSTREINATRIYFYQKKNEST
jgi:hypothetical protein